MKPPPDRSWIEFDYPVATSTLIDYAVLMVAIVVLFAIAMIVIAVG